MTNLHLKTIDYCYLKRRLEMEALAASDDDDNFNFHPELKTLPPLSWSQYGLVLIVLWCKSKSKVNNHVRVINFIHLYFLIDKLKNVPPKSNFYNTMIENQLLLSKQTAHQILRKINLAKSRTSKTAILAISKTLNFNFCNFQP